MINSEIPHRGVVFVAPGEVELLPVDIREPESGEIAVRVLTSVVSPGTEFRCLAGLQPGAPDFPFIPGYSAAGVVVAVGADVSIPIGTRVAIGGTKDASIARCWGGHVSQSISDASKALILPKDVSFEAGCLTKLAGIAHRGVVMARPKPGNTVVVVGLGPVGLLAARWFSIFGTDVLGIDRSPQRVAIASRGGITAKVPESTLMAATRSHFVDGADIVVDSTGVSSVLHQSLEALRQKSWQDGSDESPTLVIQGSYASEFSLAYQDAFSRELRLVIPRDAQRSDLVASLNAISDGCLRIDDLITTDVPCDRAAEFYATALTDPAQLTAAFRWQ